jgi:hypothetical protein
VSHAAKTVNSECAIGSGDLLDHEIVITQNHLVKMSVGFASSSATSSGSVKKSKQHK